MEQQVQFQVQDIFQAVVVVMEMVQVVQEVLVEEDVELVVLL